MSFLTIALSITSVCFIATSVFASETVASNSNNNEHFDATATAIIRQNDSKKNKLILQKNQS